MRNHINITGIFGAVVLGIFILSGCGGGQKEEAAEALQVKITREEVPPGALPPEHVITDAVRVLATVATKLQNYGVSDSVVTIISEFDIEKASDGDLAELIRKLLPDSTLNKLAAELGGEGFTGEGWQSNFDYEATADPRGVPGGSFSFPFTEFPATLRTQGKDANSETNRIIEQLVYESMIGMHSVTLDVVPSLATHWWISEDRLTYKFRLNPNARFSDGSRVTTEDVIATWKLLLDPGILAPYTNIIWGNFNEPVAESPYIVSVTAKELNWRYFIYFGGLSVFPAKYLKQIDGAGYMKEFQFRMLPGSGSYIVDTGNMQKGKFLTLKRRPDYWDIDNPKSKGSGNFDELKIVFVSDERLRFEKFKAGEFDAYVVGRAQWWAEECDFDDVKRGLVQKRKIFTDEAQGFSGIAFNMREEPFDDIRMRQAFTFMWDREKLINQLFYNEYIYLDSYYPGGIYENRTNPIYRHDFGEAVKLLAECGWKTRNQDGWLVNDKGQMLGFDFMLTNPTFERIFTIYQEDLKKVGIQLNLKQTTATTAFKMVNERKFKMHHQSWGGLFFPNPENVWSSWTADPENTNNLTGVKNERIDELCREYNVCFDQNRRAEIVREVDKILMEIQPYALGWYAPFYRILYWNKFGHPDYYLARTSDYRTMFTLWWHDKDKAAELEKAKKDKNIKLPVRETEVLYWPKFNEQHGRKFQIEGL